MTHRESLIHQEESVDPGESEMSSLESPSGDFVVEIVENLEVDVETLREEYSRELSGILAEGHKMLEAVEKDPVLCASSKIQGLAGEMAEVVFETALVKQTVWQRINEIIGVTKAGRERKKAKELLIVDNEKVIKNLRRGLGSWKRKFVEAVEDYTNNKNRSKIIDKLREEGKDFIVTYKQASKSDETKWSGVKYNVYDAIKTIVFQLLGEKKLDDAIEYWKLVPDRLDVMMDIAEKIISRVEDGFNEKNSFVSFSQNYRDLPFDHIVELWKEARSDFFQKQLEGAPDLLALYSRGWGVNGRQASLDEQKQYFAQVLEMPERQAVVSQFDTDVVEQESDGIRSPEKQALFDAYLAYTPDRIFVNCKFFEREITELGVQERTQLMQKLSEYIDGTILQRQYNILKSFLENINITEEEYTLLEKAFQKGGGESHLSDYLQKKSPLGILRNGEVLQKQGVDVDALRTKQFSVSLDSKHNLLHVLAARAENITVLLQHGEKYGCSREILKTLLSQWLTESLVDKTLLEDEPEKVQNILLLAREVNVISAEEFRGLFFQFIQSADFAVVQKLSWGDNPEIRTEINDRLIECLPSWHDSEALFLDYQAGKYFFTESQVSKLINKLIEGYNFYSLRKFFENHFIYVADSSSRLKIQEAQTIMKGLAEKNDSDILTYLKDYRKQEKITDEEYENFLEIVVPCVHIDSLNSFYGQYSDDEFFTNEKFSSKIFARLLGETTLYTKTLLTSYFKGKISFSPDQFAEAQKKFVKNVEDASKFQPYLDFATPEQCDVLVDDLISVDKQNVLLDFVFQAVNSKLSPETVEKVSTYFLEHAHGNTLHTLVEKFIILFSDRSDKEKSIFSSLQRKELLEKAVQTGDGNTLWLLLHGSKNPTFGLNGEISPLGLEDTQIKNITEALLDRGDSHALTLFILSFSSQDEYIQTAKSRAIEVLLGRGEVTDIENVLEKSLVNSTVFLSPTQKIQARDTIIERGMLAQRIGLSILLSSYPELQGDVLEKLNDSIISALSVDGTSVFYWYRKSSRTLNENQFNTLIDHVFRFRKEEVFLHFANDISEESRAASSQLTSKQCQLFFGRIDEYEPPIVKALQKLDKEFDIHFLEYLQNESFLVTSRIQKVFDCGVNLTSECRQEVGKLLDTVLSQRNFQDIRRILNIKSNFIQEHLRLFDIKSLDDEKKYTLLSSCVELKMLPKDWYDEHILVVTEKAPGDICTKQLEFATFFGNLIHNKHYEWLDTLSAEIPSQGAEGKKESASEFFKNFVETYKIGNKGETILTLLAAREYEEGMSPKDLLENIAKSLAEYRKVIDRYQPKKVPKGLRASIGLEYEITGKIAEGYAETHLGHDLKKDILKLSAAGRIGQGNDAVHEIAGKPSDNPYLVLLEMKLIQDLGFVNFNFDQPGYAQGGHGYHLTIGGERGIFLNKHTNFLQNALIMSGWGGVNAGNDVYGLGRGRGNIRERGSGGSMPVFQESATSSVELRCFSIDKCEPFERTILTSHNAAIAMQAVAKYVRTSDLDAYVSSEKFPQSIDDFLEELALNGAIDLDKIDESVAQIIFEWVKLMHETRQTVEDHNKNFLDNETSGYLDEKGDWVGTTEFGGQNNRARFEEVVKGSRGYTGFTVEEYATHKLQIPPEALFSVADPEWVNKLTSITNLFLKPSKESGGDQANVLAMLETTKLESGRIEDKKEIYLKSSVFDINGDRRQGYYNLQGGSKKLITHRVQQLLLNFNSRMEQILSEAEIQVEEQKEAEKPKEQLSLRQALRLEEVA